MRLTLLIHGLMPLGVIPVGAMAEFVGIEAALMFGAAMLVLIVWLLNVLFPGIKKIDRGHQADGANS